MQWKAFLRRCDGSCCGTFDFHSLSLSSIVAVHDALRVNFIFVVYWLIASPLVQKKRRRSHNGEGDTGKRKRRCFVGRLLQLLWDPERRRRWIEWRTASKLADSVFEERPRFVSRVSGSKLNYSKWRKVIQWLVTADRKPFFFFYLSHCSIHGAVTAAVYFTARATVVMTATVSGKICSLIRMDRENPAEQGLLCLCEIAGMKHLRGCTKYMISYHWNTISCWRTKKKKQPQINETSESKEGIRNLSWNYSLKVGVRKSKWGKKNGHYVDTEVLTTATR